MSRKYLLFADRAGQLEQREVNRQDALTLVATKTAVSPEGEWLEAFWCDQCQQKKWYCIQQHYTKGTFQMIRTYDVSVAPPELWQQAVGVIQAQSFRQRVYSQTCKGDWL